VIVVAEGAGQDLIASDIEGHDASGNVKLKDIGLYLKEHINRYFEVQEIPINLKYFDPSYFIRSVPANCDDSLLCDQFARHAVHAAMAGKTNLLIGLWYNMFIHLPISLATSKKKQISPESEFWMSALAATGQPAHFV
ncbi:MAG TPA: ATP-dependent 6-phosphofructokinase, partial [Acidobacteriota bacterium]|nr:ATP-dependent 6-phosphofructokinase [Acidobacteriota bacterium]